MSTKSKKIRAVWAVGAVLAMVAVGAPAAAANTGEGVDDGTQEVTFSVIGDVPEGVSFPVAELAEVGVSGAEIEMIQNGQVPGGVVPLPGGELHAAGANNPYQLMSRWNDNKGKPVAMRWGSSTWGWLKVTNKHNLTTAVAKTTTQHPKERIVESASSYVYRTPVHNVKCNVFGFCSVAATRTVRVVVNPVKLNDGAPKGVITAYCEGITWCESWVKNAINV